VPTRMGLIVVSAMMSLVLLGGSCAPAPDFDRQLKSVVKPYRFSIAGWEFQAIPAEVSKWLFRGSQKANDEVKLVNEYFATVGQIKSLKTEIEAVKKGDKEGDLASLQTKLDNLLVQRAANDGTVEGVIARQIKETLVEQGIYNPVVGLKVSFPPLIFSLEPPPNLLVVSPRERIESMREIPLQSTISRDEMETIEAEVDKLNVSSLVVGLGGFATYPSVVSNETDLQFALNTVAEEWLHQYLAFKPLGFRYLLDLSGIARNYEIAIMNETLAGMVSKEIGAIVYEKYYAQPESQPEAPPDFDFNREMREIRRAVDQYLAQGEIKTVEEFMEQKRQYLASKGYYIRKLNQAYFAFHGTYADRPTSISPIGVEMRELRRQSVSLKEFLETVSEMTSHQELKETLGGEFSQ
jgi:hypothetical protein